MKQLFKIGEKLPKRTTIIIEICGLIFLLLVWYLLTIPHLKPSLGFTSSAPATTTYKWSGPDNFSKEFPGDNLMSNLKIGIYNFTATRKDGVKIEGTVEIPEKFSKKIIKKFSASNGTNKFTLEIDIDASQDGFISRGIIPAPAKVLSAFPELFNDKKLPLINEVGYSLSLNIIGYLEAIIASLFLGFLIGLVPFFRALLSRWVNAIRFVPLTAVTGLFIAWFGIQSNMKIQFLSFGILVYLLPVVVQRIDDVLKIYLQTAYTLGASKWQMITSVYLPSVASKIIDDIRVLTAISWTYIIVAEVLNQSGGIGALIHLAGRSSRLDKVFALLIVIVIIGVIQDFMFALIDKFVFKFKYQVNKKF